MKALALLVVLAACGKAAPSSVTITPKAPPVGQVSIVAHEEHTSNTLGVQGKEVVIDDDLAERQRTEVLEVSAIAATKLAVTYEERTERETSEGETKQVPSPVTGKRYVVARERDLITVIDDAGAAATEDERAIVTDDHADLGQVPGMEQVLTGRVWKRGEAVRLGPDELATLDHDSGVTAGGSQTTAMTMTLTSTTGATATFTSVMQVETDNAAMALSTTITGTVKVEITSGRPLEITTNSSSHGTRLSGASAGASIQITRRSTQQYTYQ